MSWLDESDEFTEEDEIYFSAHPSTTYESRLRMTLSRVRVECLLHHEHWKDDSKSVLTTLSSSFTDDHESFCQKALNEKAIEQGFCSCRMYGGRNIKGNIYSTDIP